MSLNVQAVTLAMMLLSGIGMGAAFDGYRVVSNHLRIGRMWIPLLDLAYWIAATLVVFRVLSSSNDGEVRAYVFLGLLIGIAFYFWLFSSTVIRFVVWLIRAVQWIARVIAKCFTIFIIKPIVLVYRLVRFIVGLIMAIGIFICKMILQVLRPFWLLLRWLLRPLARLVRPWVERPAMAVWLWGQRWGARIKRAWTNFWNKGDKGE